MQEKKNSVGLIRRFFGKNDERVFNAELAWIESTYGTSSYKTIDGHSVYRINVINVFGKFRQISPVGIQRILRKSFF